MPTTTRQLSKIAKVSEQTVRNYTRDFAELLSPQARGDVGSRLFTDKDVEVFCSIATLRREGVPPTEVIERIKRGDVYIETAPQQTTPNEPQATPEPQDEPQAPIVLYGNLQRQIDALQRRQEWQDKKRDAWFVGTGVWLGMILMAAVFYAVGLLNGWWFGVPW